MSTFLTKQKITLKAEEHWEESSLGASQVAWEFGHYGVLFCVEEVKKNVYIFFELPYTHMAVNIYTHVSYTSSFVHKSLSHRRPSIYVLTWIFYVKSFSLYKFMSLCMTFFRGEFLCWSEKN